ncbi:MAG: hypothetical protein ABEK59_00950 [Halobacteria archaeon]
MPFTCPVCRRVIPVERIDDSAVVQEHHLIPENREESPTVELCRPFHKQVHNLFSNEELRERYDTVEKIRNSERIEGYVEWIRRTDNLDIDVGSGRG